MRVEIEYSYDTTSTNFPCWAKSVLNGVPVCTCGKDWADARREHIERLSKLAHSPEPPAKESIEL